MKVSILQFRKLTRPFSVQHCWPNHWWLKKVWNWRWKEDVSNNPDAGWSTNDCTITSLPNTPFVAVLSSTEEWVKKLRARSWVTSSRATFSELLAVTTSKVSKWSKVLWLPTEPDSFSRSVSLFFRLLKFVLIDVFVSQYQYLIITNNLIMGTNYRRYLLYPIPQGWALSQVRPWLHCLFWDHCSLPQSCQEGWPRDRGCYWCWASKQTRYEEKKQH